ncbi:Ribosomal RNA-processing protein 17, partial [Erysiphe necator]
MNPSIEPGIFRNPRLKKFLLPLPSKRFKSGNKLEEISFDSNLREEYLTGFHKRKVARIKNAQAEAEKKSREERRNLRKKLREERKHDLEAHIEAVNAALKRLDNTSEENDEDTEAEVKDTEKFEGFCDENQLLSSPMDYGEEFIDEEKYTTVTVEAIDVSKNGLLKKTVPEKRDAPKIQPVASDPNE